MVSVHDRKKDNPHRQLGDGELSGGGGRDRPRGDSRWGRKSLEDEDCPDRRGGIDKDVDWLFCRERGEDEYNLRILRYDHKFHAAR